MKTLEKRQGVIKILAYLLPIVFAGIIPVERASAQQKESIAVLKIDTRGISVDPTRMGMAYITGEYGDILKRAKNDGGFD